MIVTSSGRVVGGSRLVINDNINVFLGTQTVFWNNANNWSLGVIPSQNQTAIIRANCTANIDFTVKNLIVEENRTLLLNTITGTVNFDFNCFGTLNQAGFASNLVLKGISSITGIFIPGVSSLITYSSTASQNVLGLTYNRLTISGNSTKTLIGNTTVNGEFIFSSTGFNTSSYDFIVLGTSTLGNGSNSPLSQFTKTGTTGVTIFTGRANLPNFSSINLGSNILEFKGGYTINSTNSTISAGKIFFNGSQTALGATNGLGLVANCTAEISNGATLEITALGSLSVTSINGLNSSSTLLNKGTLALTSSTPSMILGILDVASFANNLYYSFNGNFTVPLTTYRNLFFTGTGIKSLSSNVSCDYLSVATSNINLGNFILQIIGASAFSGDNVNNQISSTGTGSVIFGGLVTCFNFVYFNVGASCLMEFRGGVSVAQATNLNITGKVRFTTNNQTVTSTNAFQFSLIGDLEINDAITVDFTTAGYSFNGNLIGLGATSTLKLRTVGSYLGAAAPMNTGVLDCNYIGCTFSYSRVGIQDIKSITYNNLVITGASGNVKTSLGNLQVNNILQVNQFTILELASYSLTVDGNTTPASGTSGTIRKLVAGGSLLFKGTYEYATLAIDNCDVEFRNSVIFRTDSTFGNSTIKFTTNNLNVSSFSTGANLFLNNVLVDKFVTNITTLNINGTLTGVDSASKLVNNSTINYANTQTPMLVGILDVNTVLNTFNYSRLGNQDVKGTAYRNLTLSGTATPNDKTLQGNVSVINTYAVTGNAVRVNNGFTFGNP